MSHIKRMSDLIEVVSNLTSEMGLSTKNAQEYAHTKQDFTRIPKNKLVHTHTRIYRCTHTYILIGHKKLARHKGQ
jgi:hypothetical protein